MGTKKWSLILATSAAAAAFALYLLHRRRHGRRAQKRLKIDTLAHQLQGQRTPTNTTLINTMSQWVAVEDEVTDYITTHPTVGFDCEWVKDNKVALVQLALKNGNCYLVRLCQMRVVPKSLAAILMDKEVLKLGVGIQEDAKRLENDYGVRIRGFVDLRHFVPIFRPKLKKTGLAGMTMAFLGVEMDKDWRVRASNWEEGELSQRQVDYAAADALAGVNIGLAMLKEKMEMEEEECCPEETLWRMCRSFRERPFKQRGSSKVAATTPTTTTPPTTTATTIGPLSNNSNNNKKRRPVRATPLYHNAKLEAPDGQPLCVCDTKKAEWYISKGLGTLVAEEPLTVRLNFEPTGRPEGAAGDYYLTFKENVCVVCGKTDSYVRKYIVPHEYRKHFPEVMRDHQSHDVLLLCYDCHCHSNLLDLEMRRRLEKECDAPIGTEEDIRVREDSGLREVRSAARALMKNMDKIPKERRDELETVMKEYYGVEELSEDILAKGANLESRIFNNNYQPHGKKVVEHFKHSTGGIIRLEKLWRQHFLHTMEPKYLPSLWSVDHQQERLDVKAAEMRIDEEDYKMANGLL